MLWQIDPVLAVSYPRVDIRLKVTIACWTIWLAASHCMIVFSLDSIIAQVCH